MDNNADNLNFLRTFSRKYIHTIWTGAQLGVKFYEKEEQLRQILLQHSEYSDIWEYADEIGDDDFMVDGVNPFMHVIFHQIIESQIAGSEPKEIKTAVESLTSKGHSRHDAVHQVAGMFIKELLPVLKRGRPFNTERYIEKLLKLGEQKEFDKGD